MIIPEAVHDNVQVTTCLLSATVGNVNVINLFLVSIVYISTMCGQMKYCSLFCDWMKLQEVLSPALN